MKELFCIVVVGLLLWGAISVAEIGEQVTQLNAKANRIEQILSE